MLQVSFIREHKERVLTGLEARGISAAEIVSQIISLDDRRKQAQKELDDLLEKSNLRSRQIGDLIKAGKTGEANALKQEIAAGKERTKSLGEEHGRIEDELQSLLEKVPNIPHPDVPRGKGAGDNVTVREGGTIPALAPGAVPHWDLAEKYGLISFELGNKITGAGFPVYTGKGAKLQRALIGFFLDKAVQAGYREVIPPYMVNAESAFGTGQLPDKEGQMYVMKDDPYYLIPTAEVPVTNIHRGEILGEQDLPLKYTAYTPCFRREAGSYGKDVRGLNRVHQFDKVEIVQFTSPEKSYDTLEEMTGYVESLVDALSLPYRIVRLCSGDMGFAAALTYDFEVYAAGQKRWLEVSSVSNFESFQSNRMKIRVKGRDKKTRLVHTLNGSALALPRIVAAILENNQAESGILIPEALRKYTGFDIIAP